MISTLLATKLHRPSPPGRRVERPHLVQRLNEGLAGGRRLTLVSAPAGFGKTSCVCEWLNAAGLPVAWLSLDPADDDPGRFFAYLMAALQTVDAGLGREMAGALAAGQIPPAVSFTNNLLNDVLKLRREFILALDDFHVIHAGAILDAVGRLIAGGPANMHLVLVTREDPGLPLARLRANGQLTEIRAADLRFAKSEAGDLLNGLMELSLSESDVAALENRTEGWVAGLQLAGLSMRGRPDPAGFIANLTGSHRFILSYLTEEVLDRQPEEVRDFLLQTSILEKLTAELCEAVVGRYLEEIRETEGGRVSAGRDEQRSGSGAAALLERLCAANLFVIPLDDRGEWYRYHHLFAQLLATRLRQIAPAGEVRALHCRASDWLAEHGLHDEAITHALAGKAHEKAAALVDRLALEMIFAGRLTTLHNWLGALPQASFAANPRLAIYQAWIDLLQGRSETTAQALLDRQDLLRALPPSPENDRVRVELTLILCRYLPIQGDPAGAIRLAREALRQLPEGDAGRRARVFYALAVAYGLDADAGNSDLAFHECVRLAQAAGDYGLVAEITALMGQSRHYGGQLREAARLYQSVVDLGAAPGREQFYPAGHGYIGLASIYLEWYDLDAAEQYLERGIELCTRGGLDEIYRGYYVRSRLRQAKGDLEGALAEIRLLHQAFPREDDPLKAARQVMILREMGDFEGVGRCAEPWLGILYQIQGETREGRPRRDRPYEGGSHSGSGLGPVPTGEGPADRPPTVVLEVIQTLAARALLAQGRIDQALLTLEQIRATAEPGGRAGLLIEVYLLKALALAAKRERDAVSTETKDEAPRAALAPFERSLALAEPEGYVLLFLEEGAAVVPLLQAAAEDERAAGAVREYARRLLAAFASHRGRKTAGPVPTAAVAPAAGGTAIEPACTGAAPTGTERGEAGRAALARTGAAGETPQRPPGPVEPLTERELEILRLIAEGCTNQEIAGRLVITLHTVKKHSSNIFGKLGVTSRTQAVARARRLGWL